MATPDIRGLYGLLLQAMEQESQREQADPDSAMSAAPRDPNFRQLSQAPFVERLQAASRAAEQPRGQSGAVTSRSGRDAFNSITSSPIGAGLHDPIAMRPSSPWMVNPPPMTPVPVGFRGIPSPIRQPLPFPMPSSGQESPPRIPMPPIPEPWKMLGLALEVLPRLLRERLETDESKEGDAAAGQILELYQKRRRGGGSKAGSAKILNGPSIAPDAPGEASDTADDNDDFCEQQLASEEKRCWARFPHEYRECLETAKVRFDLCNRNLRRMKEGRPPLDVPEKWGND